MEKREERRGQSTIFRRKRRSVWAKWGVSPRRPKKKDAREREEDG